MSRLAQGIKTLLCLADFAITTGHYIHPTMRALTMPMYPNNIFWTATRRASRLRYRLTDARLQAFDISS